MEQASNLAKLDVELFQAKKQIQDLETQKEVWMSLLKGLPTVIVVTVVATVTSLIYTGDGGSQIAISASIMAFIGTSVLWAFSLAFTMRADDKLVKLKDESKTIERKEEKLRAEAKDMFLRYKGSMMPGQIMNPSYGILDFDNLTITTGLVTDWRKNFTPERQADMEYLDSNLTQNMDLLRDVSLQFVSEFNEFIVAIRGGVSSLPMSGIKDTDQNQARQILIFAMYQSMTTIESSPALDREDYAAEVAKIRLSLAKELHQGSSLFEAIRSMALSETIIDKAWKAKETHDGAIELFSRMTAEFKYEYSAET
jgi:hypothetical protein